MWPCKAQICSRVASLSLACSARRLSTWSFNWAIISAIIAANFWASPCGAAVCCSMLPSWRLFSISATVFDLRPVEGAGSQMSQCSWSWCPGFVASNNVRLNQLLRADILQATLQLTQTILLGSWSSHNRS
ncbi:hypothetical protein N658DRAFT_488875 [Parathielavia hyrcaniae]|uniref:Uncharacterized protein n=1 Tax=Parathielavia hyrcaniae TaxID=113614 RepID=A0AAN6PWF1_9PEZI|nr:hypothetical protein N658DRAFT_488875 [Parathielavia hyrcaniae]